METLASFAQTNLIARMGSTDAGSFDKGWLFARCGLQPDGTGIKECQQVIFVWNMLYLKTLPMLIQLLSKCN
jgi:hypothetical protein